VKHNLIIGGKIRCSVIYRGWSNKFLAMLVFLFREYGRLVVMLYTTENGVSVLIFKQYVLILDK